MAATTSRANSKDERMLTQTTKASKSRLTPRDRVRLRAMTIQRQCEMGLPVGETGPVHISVCLRELLFLLGIVTEDA